MRKPLELIVHRKFEDRLGAEWYVWQGTCIMPWIASEYVTRKRFTDAELAAEYWQAAEGSSIRAYQRDSKGNIIDIRGVGWEYEREVLARFATLPSYDEVA